MGYTLATCPDFWDHFTYVERYNRTVRYEWLGQYIFETIEEVQEHATRRLWTYNNERPNMAVGGITPAMKLKTAAGSPGHPVHIHRLD